MNRPSRMSERPGTDARPGHHGSPPQAGSETPSFHGTALRGGGTRACAQRCPRLVDSGKKPGRRDVRAGAVSPVGHHKRAGARPGSNTPLSVTRPAAALAGAFAALVAASSCAPPPDVAVRAPPLLAQALDVVTDLGAGAVLVPEGGAALAAVALTRGDDGVSFTGFLDAAPGRYTLEIAFDGTATAAPGARLFLGRLTSDVFTVSQGQAATPIFSTRLDTLGRPEDGGDADADGLGVLLELIIGADPAVPDTDADGVLDGADCRPDDVTNAFPITAGGDHADCDADGFDADVPIIGAAGDDCDDTDALMSPAADDDCGTLLDTDCNPATCPVDDSEGPTVALVAPAAGTAVGCHGRVLVGASDPSDVQSLSGQLPDRPITGGFARFLLFTDQGDGTWRSSPLNDSGPGLVTGSERLSVTATDTRGNSSAFEAQIDVAIAVPVIGWDAPGALGTTPVTVNVTTSGPRPLASLQIFRADLDENTLIDMDTAVPFATLPATGGSTTIDPLQVPDNSALFPVAVDDIGNTLRPTDFGFPNAGTTTADFRCDGGNHTLPVTVRRGDRGRSTMRDLLATSIARAQSVDPQQRLMTVNGIGVGADGAIDLASTTGTTFWSFTFSNTSGTAGVTVTWYNASVALDFPFVQSGSGDTDPPIADVAALVDSDVAVAAYDCGGTGPTGNGSDSILYTRDFGGTLDFIYLSTADGYSWSVHADDPSVDFGGCDPP